MRDDIIAAEMERGSSSISVGKVMAGDERINWGKEGSTKGVLF